MPFSDEDRAELRSAKKRLERRSLTQRLLDPLSRPIERGLAMLPDRAKRLIESATYSALQAALRVAIGTLGREPQRASHDNAHVLAAAAAGASGFFGLAALPLELPLTTTVMLRSIADIARSHGEDLADTSVRLACLEVFALRGGDSSSSLGYYGVRTALSRSIREAALYLAGGGAVDLEAPAIVRLIAQLAERFGLSVSEQAAATAIPIFGAVGGAAVNIAFIGHYQKLAHAHFAVRRLERLHGAEAVEAEYERL